MPTTTSLSQRESAGEIVAAIMCQAEFAATLVDHFLNSLGFGATAANPKSFPRWFLLDLGNALQIAWWELAGVVNFIPETLPSARSLIRDVFETANDPQAYWTRAPNQTLGIRLMEIHVRHFAFRPFPFAAGVVVGRVNQAELVDALAKYLWNTRDQCSGHENISSREQS